MRSGSPMQFAQSIHFKSFNPIYPYTLKGKQHPQGYGAPSTAV